MSNVSNSSITYGLHDLGPSALIEVHAPDTLWKTVQPPVSVRLPLTLSNGKLFNPSPAVVLFVLALLMSGEAFVFWRVVVVGEPDVAQHLRGIWALLLGAGFIPFIRVMYYNNVVNSLATGECIFIGVNGFIDIRLLSEPRTNVTEIEPVVTKGGLVGAKLKLKTSCLFNKKFESRVPKIFFKKYRDHQCIYISMNWLKYNDEKYDPRLLFEVFKERINNNQVN